MRKLKLDLDSLCVDTFSTGTEGDGNGTVQANLYDLPTNSENNQMTCGQQSCQGPSCHTCSICMTVGYGCQQEELEAAW